MIAQIYFSKIDCIRPGSETTILDFKPQPIAPVEVMVGTKEGLRHAVGTYVEMATASGYCGRVYVKKVGKGRAFPGFNEIAAGSILVNKHVGEAAPDV